MFDLVRSFFKRFHSDERGTIAIIFAGAIILLVVACGVAIDIGRAFHAKARIGFSIDAAALAAAKGLRLQGLSDSEVTALANKIFNQNYDGEGTKHGGIFADIKSLNVTIDRANSAVSIDVVADVKTTFGRLAGVQKFNLTNAGSAIFEAQDIEVGLQLDVTGSMGGQKIADLKLATKDLVDILIPDTPTGQKVRIGYAPFAAGVNAGSYASAVNGNVAAPNDCVYERRDLQYQDTDNSPIGQSALKTQLDLPSAQNCPNATVLPMTDNKTVLKTTVDSYSTGGCTAGHQGTAWAWYLLSPNWASVWPAASRPEAYGTANVRKVAILMTDGQYNIVGGSNCSQVATSSNYARDTCTAMKAQGIVVYTVGFQLFDPTAIATLDHCATDATKAFTAANGAQLRQAFRDIAISITRLRLTS